MAGNTGENSARQVYEDKAARVCTVMLPARTTVLVNGIPAQLAMDALVMTHPANVPMMFPDPDAPRTVPFDRAAFDQAHGLKPADPRD